MTKTITTRWIQVSLESLTSSLETSEAGDGGKSMLLDGWTLHVEGDATA